MRYCSVCNSKVANFLPLDVQYFQKFNSLGVPYSLEDFETLNLGQYACPHCGASDRDRLYALYIRHHVESRNSNIKVLDIAPATALSGFMRAQPQISYRSADLYSSLADDNVDITAMHCYADGAFDFVVCSHVLEHVPDDAAAIAELFRVLAPGGHAILMVPILTTATATDEDPNEMDELERWRRFGQGDHIRLYDREEFCRRLSRGGFVVQRFSAVDFSLELYRTCGISPSSVLYVGTKD